MAIEENTLWKEGFKTIVENVTRYVNNQCRIRARRWRWDWWWWYSRLIRNAKSKKQNIMCKNKKKHYVKVTAFSMPIQNSPRFRLKSIKCRLFNNHTFAYLPVTWTLSPPIPLGLYTLPYWSNPPFCIFDIGALWRWRLSARAPECSEIKNGGLDQYAANPMNSSDLEPLALKGLMLILLH